MDVRKQFIGASRHRLTLFSQQRLCKDMLHCSCICFYDSSKPLAAALLEHSEVAVLSCSHGSRPSDSQSARRVRGTWTYVTF